MIGGLKQLDSTTQQGAGPRELKIIDDPVGVTRVKDPGRAKRLICVAQTPAQLRYASIRAGFAP